MTWQHPFSKNTITSVFGENDPPRTSPHRGVDYAPGGRKIIPAVTDGTITAIFYSNCLGWVCELKSDDGRIYIGHSHLYCNKHKTVNCDGSGHEDGSTCMKNLKVGERVIQGQPVGRVGNSGECSRGSHLHLTMSKKSDPRWAKTFDPVKFIDKKIAKQNKGKDDGIRKQEKRRPQKINPLEALAKAGVRIGTIWTWGKSKRD